MPLERLWTDRELDSLDSTVRQLRRSRTAATSQAIGIVGRILQRDVPPANKQAVLLDARDLATSAADFLAAKISKTSDGSLEFEKWQDTLSTSTGKYKGKQTTSARTRPIEVSLNMIDKLRLLSVDTNYTLKFLLTQFNEVGTENLHILSTQVGVIAPLSGDYLLAGVCRSLLERTKDETFALKLAATDSRLEVVLFEEGQLGQDLANLPNIGIFLDAIQTSNTGRALHNATLRKFPGKRVYEPKNVATMLEPSNKIKKVMREAGME